MFEQKKDFEKEKEKNQIKTQEKEAKKPEETKPEEKKDKKEEKIEELTELVKRIQAEFENFKKREEKDRKIFVEFSNAELIKNLLPVMDSIDSAKKNSDENERKGIELIEKQLKQTLEEYGLKEIKAIGKKFDSGLHDCLMQENNPEKEDGIILEEFQKGYMLKDKVLRHSKVKINSGREEKKEKGIEEKKRIGCD